MGAGCLSETGGASLWRMYCTAAHRTVEGGWWDGWIDGIYDSGGGADGVDYLVARALAQQLGVRGWDVEYSKWGDGQTVPRLTRDHY